MSLAKSCTTRNHVAFLFPKTLPEPLSNLMSWHKKCLKQGMVPKQCQNAQNLRNTFYGKTGALVCDILYWETFTKKCLTAPYIGKCLFDSDYVLGNVYVPPRYIWELLFLWQKTSEDMS